MCIFLSPLIFETARVDRQYYYSDIWTVQISRVASCIAQKVEYRVVCRGLKLDRETRDSDNMGDIWIIKYRATPRLSRKISCVASCFVGRHLNARHDFLRDTQCDTRYFARYSRSRRTIFCATVAKRRTIFCAIYLALGFLRRRAIFCAYSRARRFDILNTHNIAFMASCVVCRPWWKKGDIIYGTIRIS